MKTYRCYFVAIANVNAPTAHVAFISGVDYGDAWRKARAILSRAATARGTLTSDESGKTPLTLPAGDLVIASLYAPDEKKKKVNVDRSAAQAVFDDAKKTPEEKLAAMQALLAAQ